MSNTDWKNEHANKASASIKHELVESVNQEATSHQLDLAADGES